MINSKPKTFGNVYRPPVGDNRDSNVESSIQKFQPVVDRITRDSSPVVILGDADKDLGERIFSLLGVQISVCIVDHGRLYGSYTLSRLYCLL